MSHSTAVRCKLTIFIIWSLPMNGSTRNNSMKHIYAIIISIIFLISISYLHILFSYCRSHARTHIWCMKLHAYIWTDNVIRNKLKGWTKHPVALLWLDGVQTWFRSTLTNLYFIQQLRPLVFILTNLVKKNILQAFLESIS